MIMLHNFKQLIDINFNHNLKVRRHVERFTPLKSLFTFGVLVIILELFHVGMFISFFVGDMALFFILFILRIPLTVAIYWFFQIVKEDLMMYQSVRFLHTVVVSTVYRVHTFLTNFLIK